MLGYYAIYASPEGQRMLSETSPTKAGFLPHQIGNRNAAWPRDLGVLSAFLGQAKRIA